MSCRASVKWLPTTRRWASSSSPGIAPAPRGVPQIEVSFDIDANGIVNVSAKDLGTGKEQNITITASSNLSKEDIDKAVKEAEQFAAEDKKHKDEVDTHNAADQVIYQTEKTLSELGDKVSESEKAPVQAALEDLKTKNKGNDIEAIKAATRCRAEGVLRHLREAVSAGRPAAGRGQ